MLEKARDGQTLWLPDAREEFACCESAVSLVLRLTLWDGSVRDYAHRLPRWENAEERELVRSYLIASMFNALSVCGGRELRLFFDPRERAVAALAEEAQAAFQSTPGLNKVLRIAERMGRAFGGGFAFAVSNIVEYAPLRQAPESVSPDLAGTLLELCLRAEGQNCVGIDVGGTDIKLAASRRGKLVAVKEYDWNPAASPTADGIIAPILALLREMREAIGEPPDAVGVSFPDIVLRDRIVGGETPKTDGMRRNPALDYEAEFARLGGLKDAILALCRPGARCHITNDGNAAAFTAAVEMAVSGTGLRGGVIAHTLGTDLGSGWLRADGTIPELPLELYDVLIDLGSFPDAALPPVDLRSTRNENSGLPGARRYLGQAAAWRIAYALDPAMVEDFIVRDGGTPKIAMQPRDMRKECLAHLMTLADAGKPEAEAVFRQIGRNLAAVTREMCFLLAPETDRRCLYGRFVKSPRCFALIREGFSETIRAISLAAADDGMANSSLARQLAEMPGVTVAQFGQAVGAIYFAYSS